MEVVESCNNEENVKMKKIKNVELILNFKLVILIVIFVWLDSEILWELCRYCGDKVNEYIFFKDLSLRNEKNKILYFEFDIKFRFWMKCKYEMLGM